MSLEDRSYSAPDRLLPEHFAWLSDLILHASTRGFSSLSISAAMRCSVACAASSLRSTMIAASIAVEELELSIAQLGAQRRRIVIQLQQNSSAVPVSGMQDVLLAGVPSAWR